MRKTKSAVFTLEQTNQLIIDNIKTGVVVVSPAGKIKSINRAGVTFLSIPAVPEIARERLPYRLVDKLQEWRNDNHQSTATFHTREASPELIATFSTLGPVTTTADTLIFIEDSTEA